MSRGPRLLAVVLLALGVAGLPQIAHAEGTTVSGKVVDETGAPLNRLDVFLSSAGSTVTGSAGAFTLTGVPAGSATLSFYDNDFQQFFFDDYLDVEVTDAPLDLGTIVLKSTPNPGRSATAIDTSSKAAVKSAYRNMLRPTLRDERNLKPTGCKVAATPLAAQRRTIKAVNFMRAMSGIDPVALDTTLSAKAQKAALIQHYQGFLSHYPSPSARCYTKVGADASGKSNLALGWEGAWNILGYMVDPGASNFFVGHRRWILDPFTETMGTGQVGRAEALYVLSKFSDANRVPRQLSWPTAGYFPYQLEPQRRWSFSLVRRDLSLADARVKVLSGTNKLRLHRFPVLPGYGDQDTLSWDLAKRPAVKAGHVRTLTVTITGIQRRGVTLPAYIYKVKLFR